MTASYPKAPSAEKKSVIRPSRVAFSLLCVFLFLLILKNPQLAIDNMTKGLELCAKVIIPSLFPFMVLSELIVSTGAITFAARLFERPAEALFRVRGECAVAILLGCICGFPIGAKCASSLYGQGIIGKEEYARLLTFVNIPGPAFLVGTVGVSMFGGKGIGIALYIITLLSSLTVGFLGARIGKKSSPRWGTVPGSVGDTKQERRLTSVLTGAISSSALSLLNVCAFILFFFTLVGVISSILESLDLPPIANALCLGIFEITGGISSAASLGDAGILVAAFISGWSGLSVCFQIMSVCEGDGVSFVPLMLSRLICGILNLIMMTLIYPIIR